MILKIGLVLEHIEKIEDTVENIREVQEKEERRMTTHNQATRQHFSEELNHEAQDLLGINLRNTSLVHRKPYGTLVTPMSRPCPPSNQNLFEIKVLTDFFSNEEIIDGQVEPDDEEEIFF